MRPSTASRLALLLGVAVLSICAQASQPVFRLFTTEDGLVRNWVSEIRRDSRGRLWFCTVEGLSVFDGQTFTNYAGSDLPYRAVSDIAEAGDGTYWLATYAGLYRFRPRTTQPPAFQRVPLGGGPGDRPIATLLRTRSGQVWCGTEGGLYRIETAGAQARGVAVPLATAGNKDAYPAVNALAEGSDGALWIGTLGVIRWRPDGSLWFAGKREGVPIPTEVLMFDRNGLLWAGGEGGMARIDARREIPSIMPYPFASGRPPYHVLSMLEDDSGDFWLGGFGLARFRPGSTDVRQRLHLFDSASVLGSQHIGKLINDPAGHIWAAVSNGGVARMLLPEFSAFTQADGLESTAVFSVFEAGDGKVYALSGQRHALNQFDGERFSTIRPRVPRSLHYFGWGEGRLTLQGKNGEWWMATGQGLVRYPRTTATRLAQTPPKAIYGQRNGLASDAILQLFEDRDGNVWVGSAPGTARWNSSTETFEDLTSAVSAATGRLSNALSFAQDRAGNVWIGLYPSGVMRYRQGRMESITEGVPAGVINALLVDGQGTLWIASSQQGLGRIVDPTVLHPRCEPQAAGTLRSRQLFALAMDHAGRLYVAGGQGVDGLNLRTGAIRHFNASNGLPPGETQRLYCDREGAIWFASNFGLSRYLPEADTVEYPAAPSIRSVRVSGAQVAASDEGESRVGPLRLAPGKDSIAIDFGSVDFSVSDVVRYRYRLLPAETDWQGPTAARSVQYAGIGPGAYRLEVQAVRANPRLASPTATVTFEIAAPFWKTWWFRMLAGAFLASLAFVAYLIRARRLMVLERVRASLAADLHDDLGAGLTEIAILTEVARQRYKEQSLEIMAQRARELRSTMSDIVWSVDPQHDNLNDVIGRCRQTAFALLGNENVEFFAPDDERTAGVSMSPAHRHHVLLLFKEAVTNVARHAFAGRVTVRIAYQEGVLEMSVTDDGCGFVTQQAGSGCGLRNMEQRAAALNASLVIRSRPGNGTTVLVRIPELQARMKMRLSLLRVLRTLHSGRHKQQSRGKTSRPAACAQGDV